MLNDPTCFQRRSNREKSWGFSRQRCICSNFHPPFLLIVLIVKTIVAEITYCVLKDKPADISYYLLLYVWAIDCIMSDTVHVLRKERHAEKESPVWKQRLYASCEKLLSTLGHLRSESAMLFICAGYIIYFVHRYVTILIQTMIVC